jgi:hypothetical protein
MSDEPLDDLSRQKLKRATGMLNNVSRSIGAVIEAAPEDEDSMSALDQEVHRRGLPEWISFDLLSWPMGAISFGSSLLIKAGLDAVKIRQALSMICVEMLKDSFPGDGGADPIGEGFESFADDLDLRCDCDQYVCPRRIERIGQARHAFMTAVSATFNLFDSPYISPIDFERSTQEQIEAFKLTAKTIDEQFRLSTMAKVESILELLIGILVDAKMI